MQALKFRLSGKTAFFKKPEVNEFCYFTYGTIHKIALLGIFGAIVGYKGYNQMKINKKKIEESDEFPQFYEELKNLKISVLPEANKGIVTTKIQEFNNSVGYASKEQGGNLIVREQWIEEPAWTIYLLLDQEKAEHIKEFICNKKAVYFPYLGKNDHFARIDDIEIVSLDDRVKGRNRIDSIVQKEKVNMVMDDLDDDDDDEFVELYQYRESLPIGLNPITNLYEYQSFLYTNCTLEWEEQSVYYDEKNNKYLMFF